MTELQTTCNSMGWYKYDLNDGHELWTRGGFRDLHIKLAVDCYDHPEITIPAELLRKLAKEDKTMQDPIHIETEYDKPNAISGCTANNAPSLGLAYGQTGGEN